MENKSLCRVIWCTFTVVRLCTVCSLVTQSDSAVHTFVTEFETLGPSGRIAAKANVTNTRT